MRVDHENRDDLLRYALGPLSISLNRPNREPYCWAACLRGEEPRLRKGEMTQNKLRYDGLKLFAVIRVCRLV